VGTGCGDVGVQLRRAAGVRHFDMAYCEVGAAQQRSDSVEPVIRLRNVEYQVTCEDEIDVAHEKIRAIHRRLRNRIRTVPLAGRKLN
jgi:hypothetical protein